MKALDIGASLKTWGMDELLSTLDKLGRRRGARRNSYDATKSTTIVGRNQAAGFVELKVTPLQPGAFEGNFARGHRMKVLDTGQIVSRPQYRAAKDAWWKANFSARGQALQMRKARELARIARNEGREVLPHRSGGGHAGPQT